MKYNVVELAIDELEEYLIMRCSSFNNADRICNLLLDYIILSSNENKGPQLIVIDGGKV